MIRKCALVSSLLLLVGCGGGESNVTVTATAGVGGAITPASQRLAKGATASFTIQPNAIYTTLNVTGCGGTLAGSTYTANNVRSNCAVTASFRLKPLSMDLTALPQGLAEATETTIAINNVRTSVNISSTSSSPAVSVVQGDGNSFIIRTSEVDREITATITVSATDGDDATRQATSTFTVTVNNTSFTEDLSIIEVLTTQRERFIHAMDENALLFALRDTAMLADVSIDTRSNGASAQNTGHDLGNAIAAIHLNDYLNGRVGDGPLLAAKALAMTSLETHMSKYRTSINNYMDALSGVLPRAVVAGNYMITPELKRASFFVGNPDFGSVVDGVWVFNDNVSYLSGLINADCGL